GGGGVWGGTVRDRQGGVEARGIEDTSERIPDVGEWIRLLGQRAGAAYLDDHVLALGEVQHLRQVGPRLRRGRWRAGLHDTEMIDDEARIGVAIDQYRARIHVAPA